MRYEIKSLLELQEVMDQLDEEDRLSLYIEVDEKITAHVCFRFSYNKLKLHESITYSVK